MGNMFSTTKNIANNAIKNITNTIVDTLVTNNSQSFASAKINICGSSGNDCTNALISNCMSNGCEYDVKQCTPHATNICQQMLLCKTGDEPCKNPNFLKDCNSLGCNVSDVKLTQTVYILDDASQKFQLTQAIKDSLDANLQQNMKNAGTQSSLAGALFGSNIGNTTIQEINDKKSSITNSKLIAGLVNNVTNNIKTSIIIQAGPSTDVKSISSTQVTNFINDAIQNDTEVMNIINDLSDKIDQDIQNNSMWLKIILYILLAVVLIIIVFTIYTLVKKYAQNSKEKSNKKTKK